MLSAVSYFNPYADKGTLRDFVQIETWQKAAAVACTALESIAILYLASYAGLTAVCVALPIAGLCAIATFRAVVAFAAARISTPPPEPITVLPSIVGMNASQIKKAICEMKVRAFLLPNQDLGTASDNGDCFYDALAQLLRAQGVDVTVQALRDDILKALNNPQWRQHLEDKVRQDPRGIGSFEDFCRDVGKATEQMGSKGPIWGDARREGVILCHKYKFNLRVLQAGLIESNLAEDEQLTTSSNLKQYLQEHEPNNPLIATHEANYHARYRELCNLDANYFTDDQTVPKESPHPVTLTIALFSDHFVPVLTR